MSDCSVDHVVVVLLVGLHIFPKFEPGVQVVVPLLFGRDASGRATCPSWLRLRRSLLDR
jgi:hypothetical protein